jgi:hypothetical protein
LEKAPWYKIKKNHMRDLDGVTISEDTAHTTEERFREFLHDRRKALKEPGHAQQGEHFVVIKEACGNGYLALTLAALLTIIGFAADWIYGETVGFAKQLVVLVSMAGTAWYLRKTHLIHVRREFVYCTQAMPGKSGRQNPRRSSEAYDR